MENNIENKAKFFAQYWGQDVLKLKLSHSNPTATVKGVWIDQNISKDYLQLKSLSSITDEDAIEVAKICEYYKPTARIAKHALGIEIMQDESPFEFDLGDSGIVIDFLRSRGYALPFMGTSVEKLIEYGWVKLSPTAN